jgi:hypothetical protein
MVRAKFTVTKISKFTFPQTEIILTPQYDDSIPEDRRFSKATPSGEFRMFIDNPAAEQFFELGQPYYIDISKAG